MKDRKEMFDLAHRCEMASHWQYRLDDEISRAMADENGNYAFREYTRLFDDALLLVPEDWTAWEVRSRRRKTIFSAELSRLNAEGEEECLATRAATPALALCAVALRAQGGVTEGRDFEEGSGSEASSTRSAKADAP